MTFDEILDDLFHGCAVAAFVEEARAAQGWPEQEKTRQQAYATYEEERKSLARTADPVYPPKP